MKKIMFNDRYCLTQAVIEGRKTMTRRNELCDSYQRIMNDDGVSCTVDGVGMTVWQNGQILMMIPFRYKVGEIVAVAQRYNTVYRCDFSEFNAPPSPDHSDVGWINKMFVRADLMPHRIRITGVRAERLQDITDEECMKEGIQVLDDRYYYRDNGGRIVDDFGNPRAAFASLIDKVSGKGTWKRNPWVWVYEFELVK